MEKEIKLNWQEQDFIFEVLNEKLEKDLDMKTKFIINGIIRKIKE